MNHSPAYILAQYLIGEGGASDPLASGSWPLFVGALPDGDRTEDDALAAMDTAPMKDGRTMGGAPLFHHGVQLLLRSSDYNAGYSKIHALGVALAAVDGASVVEGGSIYTLFNISQTTGVIALGQEAGTKRRVMFSVNFLATIQEV